VLPTDVTSVHIVGAVVDADDGTRVYVSQLAALRLTPQLSANRARIASLAMRSSPLSVFHTT
jgi:hypothetical protein